MQIFCKGRANLAFKKEGGTTASSIRGALETMFKSYFGIFKGGGGGGGKIDTTKPPPPKYSKLFFKIGHVHIATTLQTQVFFFKNF